MQIFDFIPADTLFCRDQRPLAAGSSFGHGANWPLPTVLHSAIRTALLRANGGLPERKRQAGHERRGVKRGEMITEKYQWLNLRGPFPVDKTGTLYFPIPRDLVPVAAVYDRRPTDGDEDRRSQTAATETPVAYLQVIKNRGGNNLPAPLTHLAASFAAPSKAKLPEWISAAEYAAYLAGTLTALPDREPLWDTEHRIGVAIDPDTHTAKEGQLYAAEHLRLRDDVKLRFAISEDPHHKEPADLAEKILQLGGEQRFGKVDFVGEGELPLPALLQKDCHSERSEESPSFPSCLVKWILLTPAIFIHGWRPGWIGDDGKVLLRVVDKNKRADRRRPRYDDPHWKYDPHQDDAEPIAAKLVAAVVGKPQVVGGWDDAPKPTHLAVPSGSVYYFQAGVDDQTDEQKHAEAQKLARALQGRCKSDFFGEKGLGLGVCGTWEEGSNS